MSERTLTIIMYHYIRDVEKTSFSKLHAISRNRFHEQIEKIKSQYTIISINDVRDAFENSVTLPQNACVLSFDDGFRDHYENVFPLLGSQRISAVFFPVTCSFEGRVADVHKLHFLLAKAGAPRLIHEYHDWLARMSKTLVGEYSIDGHEKLDPRYRFDDILTANFKTRMQFLPEEMKRSYLDPVFRKFIGNEEEFSKRLYMSPEEVKKLSEADLVIGSHTHTHRRLDSLSVDDVREELSRSKKILEDVIQKNVDIISYPYGNTNSEIISLAKAVGYSLALGTEVGVNDAHSMNRYILKRVNANSL